MNEINQISIEKIKKWFKKINQGKQSYDKEGIRPTGDWNIIIIAVFVIFCLEAMLATLIYYQIENGAWFQTSADTVLTKVSVNQNLLEKITGQIDTKSSSYSAGSSGGVSDPSL